MSDIFLSYSSDDQAIARRFAESLERECFSIWWDASLRSGEAYDQVIEEALRDAKAVVVLWSKTSVESRWVRAEATTADRNKTLAPVMIEPCNRPIMFELIHTADLSHWNGDSDDEAWRTYVADVHRLVDKDGPTQVAAPTRSGSAGSASVSGSSHGAGGAKKIGLTTTAVLALLLIAGGMWWAFMRGGATHSLMHAEQTAQPGVSLAVLPFVNMSADPQQEYFSDGLSEELLNSLAQIKELRVAGRTSSFSFKGKNEDLRVIAEKLGVNHLLEGSVRKDGKRLRITAQLINAADGTHLWSQIYDRELSDVFAVQEEIATAVSGALSVTLNVGEMSRAKGGTTNLEAYDRYLQAQALFYGSGDAEEFQQAAQRYQDALALDPSFARAWYGLYRALGQIRSYGQLSSAEIQDVSQASAKIVALAPDASWTQTMRASEFVQAHKWSEADAAFSAALLLPPTPDMALTYGMFLAQVGRTRDALESIRRAAQADPLSRAVSLELQVTLFDAGRTAEAIAEYQRGKGLAGSSDLADFFALFMMWSRKDADPAVVTALMNHLMERSRPEFAAALHNWGDRQATRAGLRNLFADPINQDSAFVLIADHYGEKDMALAALRHVFIDRHQTIFRALWWFSASDMRADPRFKDILRDLGLADYYRASGKWGDFCKPVGKDDFECR